MGKLESPVILEKREAMLVVKQWVFFIIIPEERSGTYHEGNISSSSLVRCGKGEH